MSTNLSVAVIAPTLELSRTVRSAHKSGSALCLIQSEPAPEVNGIEIVAHFARVITAVFSVLLTELPLIVAAKALHLHFRRDDTCKKVAHHQAVGLESRAQIHSVQVIAHLIAVIAQILRDTQSQLTVAGISPALHLVIVIDGASVILTHRHLSHCKRTAQIHHHHVIAHFVAVITTIGTVAVAELTAVIGAKAINITVRAQEAVMVAAR